MNKVVSIFMNADLRCQHNGLYRLASKRGIKIDSLRQGEHVIFVNSQQNKVKMFSYNGLLSYLSLSRGKVDVRTLTEMASTFGNVSKLSYKSSVKKLVNIKLKSQTRINNKTKKQTVTPFYGSMH